MYDIAVTSRPILESDPARLVLQDSEGQMRQLDISPGLSLTLIAHVNKERHCVGWYDILAHQNYPCEKKRVVDAKFDTCMDCRNRTGFNPAFYNSNTISRAQAIYNQQSHSVYVAYFGNGIAKVGIMSDSRGLERVYEQGALLYVYLGSFPSAMDARRLEASLIESGLRNSVTKKQKEDVLRSRFSVSDETRAFADLLRRLDLNYADKIIDNTAHFFYGDYPGEQITPIDKPTASGVVIGLIGRYLVLRNNDRLFGYWLSSTFGYEVELKDHVEDIEAKPLQPSLF